MNSESLHKNRKKDWEIERKSINGILGIAIARKAGGRRVTIQEEISKSIPNPWIYSTSSFSMLLLSSLVITQIQNNIEKKRKIVQNKRKTYIHVLLRNMKYLNDHFQECMT